MVEPTSDLNELLNAIDAVLADAEQGIDEAMHTHRTTILSMFAQAVVEYNFEERQLNWLNDLLESIADDNPAELKRLLEQEEDVDYQFLGSQFAATMAGSYHHDACLTTAQAIGIKALLQHTEGETDA